MKTSSKVFQMQFLLGFLGFLVLSGCGLWGRTDVRLSGVSPTAIEWQLGTIPPTLEFELVIKGPAPEASVEGFYVRILNFSGDTLREKEYEGHYGVLPRVPDIEDVIVKIPLTLPVQDWDLATGLYALEISLKINSPQGPYYLEPAQITLQVVEGENAEVMPPTVEILDPKDGDQVTGEITVHVRVSASPGTEVDEVKLFLRSQLVGSLTGQTDIYFPVDTTKFNNGDAELRAEARAKKEDKFSPWAVDAISIVLDNKIPPALQIAEPADGDVVSGVLPVVVVVQKRATDFIYNGPVRVSLFDYDNHLVDVREMVAPDNEDFIGRIDPPFDISSDYSPNDLYFIEVEAPILLKGESEPRVLSQRIQVSTASESNLPPALRLDFPFRLNGYDVNASPAIGVPVVGDSFGLMGLVTDDSGSVHAIEVSLICDGSISTTEDDSCKEAPVRALMLYLAVPYGLYDGQIFTYSTPYIPDGLYILKVVAIDSSDTNLRNTQEIVVRVDRSDLAEAEREPLKSARIELDKPLIQAPDTAQWTLNLSSSINPVRMHLSLVRIDEPHRPLQIVVADIPSGGSFTFVRAFTKGENGVYTIHVGLTDLITGATVYRSDAPTLTVQGSGD